MNPLFSKWLVFFPVSEIQRKLLQAGSSLPHQTRFSPRQRKKKDLRGSSGAVEGGDNAVIFKSNSEQLKSHFIHQVTMKHRALNGMVRDN